MGLLNKYHKVKTPVFFKNAENISPLSTRSATAMPWHIPMLELPAGSLNGEGVKVAILDSGVYPNHPVLECANISYQSLSRFGSYSYGEHGTAVASILVGNGYHSMHGISPNIELISFPVLSPQGIGSMHLVEKALEKCFHLGVDIINISLGSSKEDKKVRKWLDTLLECGTVIIAAGGNNGENGGVMWPAKHEGVISVGAVDPFGELCHFSSTEDLGDIDIVAPGSKIRVATNSKGVGEMSGTSFAGPMVTGISANLLSAGYKVDKSILQRSAVDLMSPGNDIATGFGRVSYSDAILLQT